MVLSVVLLGVGDWRVWPGEASAVGEDVVTIQSENILNTEIGAEVAYVAVHQDDGFTIGWASFVVGEGDAIDLDWFVAVLVAGSLADVLGCEIVSYAELMGK